MSGNVGSYRGAYAGALNFGALVNESVALNAGVAKGFNKGGKVGARVLYCTLKSCAGTFHEWLA